MTDKQATLKEMRSAWPHLSNDFWEVIKKLSLKDIEIISEALYQIKIKK